MNKQEYEQQVEMQEKERKRLLEKFKADKATPASYSVLDKIAKIYNDGRASGIRISKIFVSFTDYEMLSNELGAKVLFQDVAIDDRKGEYNKAILVRATDCAEVIAVVARLETQAAQPSANEWQKHYEGAWIQQQQAQGMQQDRPYLHSSLCNCQECEYYMRKAK